MGNQIPAVEAPRKAVRLVWEKGISWHVSSVIIKNNKTAEVEVSTYIHLIDSCSQHCYAVASILENLLKNVCERHPSIKNVYIRSDEAGCYHNNLLIASLKDIGNRVGVKIVSYDYSEPQNGKDICDRILCPMKLTIRRYCNEGHDILKDNGTKNFYWSDLSGSPMEYLISYFYLSTAYSCEEISK